MIKSIYFRNLKKWIYENQIITIIPLLICLLLIDSCRRNPYKINTSSISANIEIRRLEKDLFSLIW